MKQVAILALVALASLSAAQRPYGYQAPTLQNETAGAQLTVYGTITSVTPLTTAVDGSGGGSNDTSSTAPNSPKYAVVSVQCTILGQSPSANEINVFGFGYYNSYCFSAPTVGFTGFFFLNQSDPAGNNSYILSDHCNNPFDNSSENINALASIPNTSSCSTELVSSGIHAAGNSSANTTASVTANGSSNGSPSSSSSSGAAQVFQMGLWSSIAAIIAGVAMIM